MRKELYNLLCRELGAIAEIKHIDLWNRNVEFIEQRKGGRDRPCSWSSARYSGNR